MFEIREPYAAKWYIMRQLIPSQADKKDQPTELKRRPGTAGEATSKSPSRPSSSRDGAKSNQSVTVRPRSASSATDRNTKSKDSLPTSQKSSTATIQDANEGITELMTFGTFRGIYIKE